MSTNPTQGSVEPMRRPDHKAKRHSRPSKWEDRRRRVVEQLQRWSGTGPGLLGSQVVLTILLFPPLFSAADWLRYGA